MNIQFVDLGSAYRSQKEELDNVIQAVLDKGDFILGGAVNTFQENFAKYCGVKYCVGVDNGTNAITLALRALGIKKGDKVVVPANTYIADSIACDALGVEVVFCDVDEETQLVDANKLADVLTEDVKCAILVNLFGQQVDTHVFDYLRQYDIKIVEDCAQSVGSGKLRGDIGTYSFYPAKNLGCFGDGGAIVLNDEAMYNYLLSYRNYGSVQKYHHDTLGTNSRLDTIQAAVLNCRLSQIDKWNNKRSGAARIYDNLLEGVGDIRITKTKEGSVYHLYVIKTEHRDSLQVYLRAKNIPTGIHYPIPIHKQKCYPQFNNLSFPVSEKLADTILSLPMHPFITLEEISYICNTIKEFFDGQ